MKNCGNWACATRHFRQARLCLWMCLKKRWRPITSKNMIFQSAVSMYKTVKCRPFFRSDEGTVYFFSMATDFAKAALGAEGVGKDITMIIGNGYTKGHAQITLAELRENAAIRNLFDQKYV